MPRPAAFTAHRSGARLRTDERAWCVGMRTVTIFAFADRNGKWYEACSIPVHSRTGVSSNMLERRKLFLSAVLCGLITTPAIAQWKPERPVELVVCAAAGGGNDKAARVIQKIWQENRMLEAVVVNKVGGGGSLAYTYVSQKPDSHFIAIAQAGLLTNQITGRSPISLSDVTVLPYIGTEPVGLAVRTESPYKNLREFMDQLK